MSRKPYPSDLTDAQWEELAPLLPPDTVRGHPRTTDLREVVNGVLYVLRGGIPWSAEADCPMICRRVARCGGTFESGGMTGPGSGWRKPCGFEFGKPQDGRPPPAPPSLTASR